MFKGWSFDFKDKASFVFSPEETFVMVCKYRAIYSSYAFQLVCGACLLELFFFNYLYSIS